MVKKHANKLKIDFENCIIEEKLLQVKNHRASNDLSLINAWCIVIPPQSSKTAVALIRTYSTEDPVSLTHLKRIQKLNDSELSVIVCSEEFMDADDLKSALVDNQIPYANLKLQQVPKHCPATKELAVEWSKKYWPLIWKGNPNDQILNDVKINLDHIRTNLGLISEASRKVKETLPITTAIIDPVSKKVLALRNDERHLHPLNHSIMRCIQSVALWEQERRKTCSKEEEHYLCENYHVYTTHEPCTMCSMAMIHSRISRLIYLKQMPATGALNPKSGEGYVIQDHKLLNSSFEVWEWLGSEYLVSSLDNSINA